jgi:hypothetical protein
MEAGVISGLSPIAAIIVLGFLGIGVMVGAAYVYVKKNAPSEKKDEAVVLSATLADAGVARALIDSTDALRREICESRETRHRDSIAERDCLDKNTANLREAADAYRTAGMGNTPEKMLALLARLNGVDLTK